MTEKFYHHVPNQHADDDLIMYETKKRKLFLSKVRLVIVVALVVAIAGNAILG